IQANAHANGLDCRLVALCERALERNRALESLRSRPERRHEGVSDVLDLVAGVLLEEVARDVFVFAQQVSPGRIAETLKDFGVALDIGEDNRHDVAPGCGALRRWKLRLAARWRRYVGQEFGNGAEHLALLVAADVVAVVVGEEARIRNQLCDLAATVKWDGVVLSSVDHEGWRFNRRQQVADV